MVFRLRLVGKVWLDLVSICYSREKEKAENLSSDYNNVNIPVLGVKASGSCGYGEQSLVQMYCVCKGRNRKGKALCQSVKIFHFVL